MVKNGMYKRLMECKEIGPCEICRNHKSILSRLPPDEFIALKVQYKIIGEDAFIRMHGHLVAGAIMEHELDMEKYAEFQAENLAGGDPEACHE